MSYLWRVYLALCLLTSGWYGVAAYSGWKAPRLLPAAPLIRAGGSGLHSSGGGGGFRTSGGSWGGGK
jgi:hypothetical protein